MKKLISLVLIALTLPGCSFFRTHRMDVEQGNIITQHDVSRLSMGMSEEEVRIVMGNPVLVNIFSPNRLDYVYTFRAGHSLMVENRITCIFRNGRLTEILRSG